MSIYAIVEAIHVITAVSGLGVISALAIMSRKTEMMNLPLSRHLLKSVNWSLVLMFITGVAMLWLGGWVLASAPWFGLAFLLFIALGALAGIAQGTLKKMTVSNAPAGSPLLKKYQTLTMIMSILLILVVFLMEGKPF